MSIEDNSDSRKCKGRLVIYIGTTTNKRMSSTRYNVTDGFWVLSSLELLARLLPPLQILVPSKKGLTTLIPSQLDTPPNLFCNLPVPSGFPNRAVYSFDLSPSLSWHYLW
jgi:hypothetical protein